MLSGWDAFCVEHDLMGGVNQNVVSGNGVRGRLWGLSASIQHVTVCTVGWRCPFLQGALMCVCADIGRIYVE